ncbi:MAG: TonB-dependent receptor [Candidatus Solibacter usitatus]|nr:TonB-dependent receptor [Candidatus Solibacter usitatus]
MVTSLPLRAVAVLMLAAAAAMAQTGGGATLVGTVRDSTGSVVAGAKVTVVNTATSFLTETTTAMDGGYYVPYLIPGDYRVKVNAAGFKEFVREGLTLRSAEVPRVDIALELGAVTESVTVSASASLLNTETVLSSYVLPADVLKEVPGVMKRTVYLLQYMPGIVSVQSQAGQHIMGQAQNDIGATMDGINAKSPYTGVVNQVDGVIQGSTDAMEEVKVLTTGVSAEYGHSSGGSMKMVYKSGTNALHASFEDRYLPGSWVHRGYLTQIPLPKEAPWYYQTFDLVGSGPLVIPKIYNGRNKTFWLSDYAINHEHTINVSLGTVPTPEMLAGDFSFKDAPGGGLPIYNPFSTRQVGATWTRDPLPGNIVPQSLMDPVARKFLGLGIWNKPNQPGSPSRTGPSQNLLFVNTCRCLHRDRWDEKLDHQFSPSQKIYFRYSQGHHRGQNGDNFARAEFNASREINPVDDINGVINYTSIISRVTFNEFRLGYNRRAASNPARPDAAKDALSIPGVNPETFPYFNIGYGIAALGYTRQVGEDRVLQDNLTRIAGKHNLKMGYEMIRTLYSDKATSLPSGQYNFGGGTSLPFTPNTGIDFAAFEMGVVTSATFTKQLAIFMPRQWTHELYFQDDWKVTPNISLNLGVRWSYSSPFKTKWEQQSQFDPAAVDPVTGRLGAITHPKGAIGKRDLNNFQPRLGLAWSFRPKWVFRASFGLMTSDSSGPGGFDEYSGAFNILQPTGDPRYLFQLQSGPGPIPYTVNPDGTVPYTGASFGSRNATWRDPNLHNAYVINSSAGFQYQLGRTWLLNVTYQGTAGVGLQRSWNINQIPLSIALGGDRALQDTVFQAQQNYLRYPQFGSVSLLSNFNHNTWHSGNITIEKRYARGLLLNASFNFSKSLSNDDSLTYYNRQGKARTAWDQQKSFGAYVIYELPVGRGGRWLNQGGLVNAVLGGWKVSVSEHALSGIPLSVGHAGSPNRYLTASRVNPLMTIEQAKVSDWEMGHRFPIAAQNPIFNFNAFAYPAAYTTGSLGSRVLQAPGILWMQFFVTKSWKVIDERLKLSLRLDGHNLPWKRPNLAAPNTTYNMNNPAAWARFSGVVGDFSNYGTGQANVQMSIRAEF